MMGDLEQDTAVRRTDPRSEPDRDGIIRFGAQVSPDWALWGPVGGYLACLALRAAGEVTAATRPASISCQFVSRASFGPAELDVVVQRSSPLAESITVVLRQGTRPVLSAQVWAVSTTGSTVMQFAPTPAVPAAQSLPPIALDRLQVQSNSTGVTATASFWKNVDLRLVPRDDEDGPLHSWARFRPRAVFDDVWTNACRALICIDTAILPAVTPMLTGRFIAPNVDLYVAFHALSDAEDLLISAEGVAAGAGLAAGRASVYCAGQLTATGQSQFLWRTLKG
jgi:hypothetical protein